MRARASAVQGEKNQLNVEGSGARVAHSVAAVIERCAL